MKHLTSVLAAGLALVLCGASVRADIYTQSADWNRPAFGSGPAYPSVSWAVMGGGAMYTNTTTSTTLQAGASFTSVGSTTIASLVQTTGGTTINVTGTPAATQAVAVFALTGVVESHASGGLVSCVQGGQMRVYEVAAGSYNRQDPTSWTNGSLVATFQVLPQENVRVGNTSVQPVNLPAEVVNRFATSSINDQNLSGSLILKPLPDGTSPLHTGLSQVLPAGYEAADQVLILNNVSESINFLPNPFQPIGGIGGLNSLASAFGIGLFASTLDLSDVTTSGSYSPFAGLAGSGDYSATLTGGQILIGYQVRPVQETPEAPEPGSLALLILAGGAGFGYRLVRRRNR